MVEISSFARYPGAKSVAAIEFVKEPSSAIDIAGENIVSYSSPDQHPFVARLKALLPEGTFRSLDIKANYTNQKKVRVTRAQDGLTVLYVASNLSRLELGHPLVHFFLLGGVPISLPAGTSPQIYWPSSNEVANITIDVPADKAAIWLGERKDLLVQALKKFESALDPVIRDQVFRHIGKEEAECKPGKYRASGVCRMRAACPYPH